MRYFTELPNYKKAFMFEQLKAEEKIILLIFVLTEVDQNTSVGI